MGRGRPRRVEIMREDKELMDEPIETEEQERYSEARSNDVTTIQHATLKNVTISCLDGVNVFFNMDGIAEVGDKRVADYLLSIPSYRQI